MSMRVMINVNEQISATMIEKHFQASSLEAEVTAAPKDMMLEILKACRIDLVAFYAEDVDNAALITFFNATGDIRKILFVKKQNLGLVSEELESMLDECFTIPLDSNDLMIRLRRMYRTVEQKISLPPPQQQAAETAEQPQPQPIQYTPPVQRIEPPAVVIPAIPQQYQPAQSKPEPALTPADEEFNLTPISTNYAYTPESFRQEPAEQTVTVPAPVLQQPAEIADAGLKQEPAMDENQPDVSVQSMPEQKKKSAMQAKRAAKKGFFPRLLSAVSKVFFLVLILAVAVLAVFMVKSKISGGTPSVFGYQLYGVLSGSMSGSNPDSFDTGSLVFIKAKDVQTIVVGDIITFRGQRADAPMTTHRVVKVNSSEGNLTFTTRGDANNVDDPTPIRAEKVVGTVRGHIPYAGYLTGFAQTKTGLIFLVFIPGAFVIVYELYNIYRTLKNERKKGKND